MTTEQYHIWRFISSIKLGFQLIFLIASLSVLGSVIPQNKGFDFYAAEFGVEMARLLSFLRLDSMYSSWWFIALLLLFSLNLIACSIERLPNVWRMVWLDNLSDSPSRLNKKPLKSYIYMNGDPQTAGAELARLLRKQGWKSTIREKEGGLMLFCQKGQWSRLGPYLIHTSILVILLGALLGHLFGFQGHMFIPESAEGRVAFKRGSLSPIPLGFSLGCELFEKEHYPQGGVRSYTSRVRIDDPQHLPYPLVEEIRVNQPLRYRGISFYQSGYDALNDFFVVIRDQESGELWRTLLTGTMPASWPEGEGNIRALGITEKTGTAGRGGVIELELFVPGKPGEQNEPIKSTRIQLADNSQSEFTWQGRNYNISAAQRYGTLLLVKKDPGVPVVYLGFFLMLVGLAISLGGSHRRMWAFVVDTGARGSQVLLCGGSNRRKPSFDRCFARLSHYLLSQPQLRTVPPEERMELSDFGPAKHPPEYKAENMAENTTEKNPENPA